MLVTLCDVLKKAKSEKYAVGLFNTVNLEMARGVLAAAEEMRSPVIIGTAECLLASSDLDGLADFLLPLAKRATVPVVLHFDHGLTEERIHEAMDRGFSSIMYDCSAFEYEENVERVRKITKEAHKRGISVEGELGHVGSAVGGDDRSVLTLPADAKDFADRTGVDALAVAIGTAHGIYKTKPKLDVARLCEIAKTVSTPLVLHGGSGLSDDDFRNCIAEGIAKVNIFTDINVALARSFSENYTDGTGICELMPTLSEAVKKEVIKKMKLFGSIGKA